MKTLKSLFCIVLLCGSVVSVNAQKYSNGIFILNEDWFGHNNSTMNFLNTETGEFDYLIIQNENADSNLSLGCTAQFGTIYGDNVYIISKQDQDSGESIYTGGRVVVADAKTMKIKKSIPVIFTSESGKSIADGRAFVGVDENKGYVGTSNGIYILNLNHFEIESRIEGSENPLITGDENNADGNGPLYKNQIGLMIRTHDYVFAIQQDRGLLVINAETDKIVNVIEGCFSTMTQSKDGNIWVAANSNTAYQEYPYGLIGEEWNGNQLLKVNPETLETEYIDIKAGGVNQTWYAWTAGSLCASTHENVLYFTFNSNKWSWFTTSEMYKYDISENKFSKIFDSSNDERYFYGGGIRVNPLDGKIYATLYRDNNDQSYWLYQMNGNGEVLAEYEPIKRYWFTAMPFFPDNHAPIISDFDTIYLDSSEPTVINLSEMAQDADNLNAAITKKIIDTDNKNLLTTSIKGNTLTLTPNKDQQGTAKITVRFNSNGKTVDKELIANVFTTTGIETDVIENINVYTKEGNIYIENVKSAVKVNIYNVQGQLIFTQLASDDLVISDIDTKGIYIVKINNKTYKVII